MSGISEGFDPPNPDELWRFVALGEHDVPSSGLDTRKVRQGLSGFIGRLVRRQPTGSSPLTGEENLVALSESQAGRVVPQPDWNRGAEAFHDHLGSWLAREQPAKPIMFLVGPPYGGRLEILEALAARKPFRSVAPPGTGMISAQDQNWFRSWPEKGVWVLPRLEKCFLRRFDGLGLVRELFVRSLSGELGRGIVGCDSWAWAFLSHVWAGRPSFAETLQAVDHDRLAVLLAPASDGEGGSEFRQSDNGAYVLPPRPGGTSPASISPAFLRKLAGHSRGNLGVARATWRRALSSLPREPEAVDSTDTERMRPDTIWVTPWERLQLPEVPSQAGESEAIVLHALLLHDGLPTRQLADLLPGSETAVAERLLYLAESGLIMQEGGSWRVTPTGYPAVRAFLELNDYLVDPF